MLSHQNWYWNQNFIIGLSSITEQKKNINQLVSISSQNKFGKNKNQIIRLASIRIRQDLKVMYFFLFWLQCKMKPKKITLLTEILVIKTNVLIRVGFYSLEIQNRSNNKWASCGWVLAWYGWVWALTGQYSICAWKRVSHPHCCLNLSLIFECRFSTSVFFYIYTSWITYLSIDRYVKYPHILFCRVLRLYYL